jgi:DNA-directed RNA polymerase alpha subunit
MRISEQEYLQALEVCKKYKEQINLEYNTINKNSINNIIDVKIVDIKMSTRLLNCIFDWIGRNGDIYAWRESVFNKNEYNISYFNNIDLNKFKRIRNLGKNSLIEFEEILNKYNIEYVKPKSYYFS